MQTYPIPMIPGPVKVYPEILQAYQVDYGSGDLEPEFLGLYNRTEAGLQAIFCTKNRVAIQTGEGMLALWGALISCLLPGERVLAVATKAFAAQLHQLFEAMSTGGWFGPEEIRHFDEGAWGWCIPLFSWCNPLVQTPILLV